MFTYFLVGEDQSHRLGRIVDLKKQDSGQCCTCNLHSPHLPTRASRTSSATFSSQETLSGGEEEEWDAVQLLLNGRAQFVKDPQHYESVIWVPAIVPVTEIVLIKFSISTHGYDWYTVIVHASKLMSFWIANDLGLNIYCYSLDKTIYSKRGLHTLLYKAYY